MKRIIRAAAGLSLGLIATAGVAGAQDMGSTRAVNFGIAGGATMPMGDLGDFYNTGFNIMGTLGFQPVAMPVGLRFDAAWHSLGLDAASGDDLRVISGTANAVLTVSNTGGIKPYLIGGIGVYNADFGGNSDSQTNFGLNGGGGLEFPLAGFSTFVEARYHHAFTDDNEGDVQLVPIVFGIKF